MAYQSLYRRYRPHRFSDVRGQEHVIRALRNAVREDRVGHAYLFSGPRGTGKTSTARILAKALNCEDLKDGEPCGVCESCLAIDAGTSYDVQELDAASNNGVNDVRELIGRVSLGSPGRTKVYILDEVHMLTAQASAALLKTLEEPPPHVVFVLATTDPQKVLPTIRSRTQHFDFHLLSVEELTEHVAWVIHDAELGLPDDVIEHVVRQGAGSARDTLSALDQVAAAGGVLESAQPVDDLLEAVAAGDAGQALVAVADAVSSGRDPRVLGEAVLARLRDVFLLRMGASTDHLAPGDIDRVRAWADRLGDRATTRALEAGGRRPARDAPGARPAHPARGRPGEDHPRRRRPTRRSTPSPPGRRAGSKPPSPAAPAAPRRPPLRRPGPPRRRRRRLRRPRTPLPRPPLPPVAPAPAVAPRPAPVADGRAPGAAARPAALARPPTPPPCCPPSGPSAPTARARPPGGCGAHPPPPPPLAPRPPALLRTRTRARGPPAAAPPAGGSRPPRPPRHRHPHRLPPPTGPAPAWLRDPRPTSPPSPAVWDDADLP